MPPLQKPRIASLVPSLTELVFSLGLGDQLVARTGFCIHPRKQVRRVPKVGGTKDVDIDALLAGKPTHLVVNIDENRKETVDVLRASIPHIIVTHPLEPRDNVMLYREFGRLFDRRDTAAELISQFNAADDALRRSARGVEPLKVLYLIWKDPWFAVSRSTYVSAMLSDARLMTVPECCDTRYPVLGQADGAWNDADVILLSSEPYAFRRKHVDAVKAANPSKEVLLVDGELLSWYGSRAIKGLLYVIELRSLIDRALAARNAARYAKSSAPND